MPNGTLAAIQRDLVASAVSTRESRTLLWRVWEAWRDICKSTVSSPGAILKNHTHSVFKKPMSLADGQQP